MFYLELATELGMTVREFLSRVTSREITEYKAYYFIKNENAVRRDLEAKAKAGVTKRKGRR